MLPGTRRYTRVLPTTAQDAEREMEEAFDFDNNDDTYSVHESTPLNHSNRTVAESSGSASPNGNRGTTLGSVPGAYNFEREYEYDYPPPGSPPRPSNTNALPNDVGNNNSALPSSPFNPSVPRVSFFRRITGAVLPTHYVRVPSDAGASRTIGGGTDNDGVFANVTAKPQRQRVVQTEDGNVYIAPEEIQKDAPPSYAEVQADAVPPYWESTVHAPVGMDSGAEMIIDNLPIGSFTIFCLNAFISFFFQFVGFFLTYLLHTSHAAKYGSRAGLGLTLIQFGYYSRSANADGYEDKNTGTTGSDPLLSSLVGFNVTTESTAPDDRILSASSRDWLSFFFMTFGWILVLSSLVGFWRVKRWETVLRHPIIPPSPEDLERDRAVRRNIERVFGIGFGDDDEDERAQVASSPEAAAEVRLANDLRAAGLL